MEQIVIGNGQIGTAIHKVLSKKYEVDELDLKEPNKNTEGKNMNAYISVFLILKSS